MMIYTVSGILTMTFRHIGRHNGLTFDQLLQTAAKDYNKLVNSCISFDKELMTDLEIAGGKTMHRYVLWSIANALQPKNLFADKNGVPLLFQKKTSAMDVFQLLT